MRYDPSVIHEMAEKLYSDGEFVERLYAIVGFLIGVAPGYFLSGAIGVPALLTVVFVGGLCALLGFWLGHQQAMIYRLFAQLFLAHAQIEENTRPASTGSWTPHPTKETKAAAHRIAEALNR